MLEHIHSIRAVTFCLTVVAVFCSGRDHDVSSSVIAVTALTFYNLLALATLSTFQSVLSLTNVWCHSAVCLYFTGPRTSLLPTGTFVVFTISPSNAPHQFNGFFSYHLFPRKRCNGSISPKFSQKKKVGKREFFHVSGISYFVTHFSLLIVILWV